MNILIKLPFYTLTIILAFSVATLDPDCYAQSNLRIMDEIGGGGSTTESSSDNDNTAIYVIGGLVIAGILAYALFINKDKKAEEDTTASLDSRLIYSESGNFDSTSNELIRVKDRIPVDLFMGIKNNEALLNDKTYLLGLRVKL